MNKIIFFVVLLILISISLQRDLKAVSFNIQVFGKSKMSKPDVVEVLIKILKRYDLIFIMEIRESTDTAITELLRLLKADTKKNFQLVISERLGRTNSKEQYAYIYDPNYVRVVGSYQFPVDKNWYERAPFSIKIQSTDTSKTYFLTGTHTKPDDALAEIDHLTDVYEYYLSTSQNRWITFGDLNAACTYFPVSKRKDARIYKQRDKFTWFIGDDVKTTTKSTNCAYDRLISSKVIEGDISNVNVFKFDVEFHLSYELTIAVSDHYPIEFHIRGFNNKDSPVQSIQLPVQEPPKEPPKEEPKEEPKQEPIQELPKEEVEDINIRKYEELEQWVVSHF